jgi:hypothetical protein
MTLRPADYQQFVTRDTSQYYFPYYPGQEPNVWATWWQDKNAYEYLPLSRPNLGNMIPDPAFMYYRDWEISCQIEFLITNRCIPGFKKEGI